MKPVTLTEFDVTLPIEHVEPGVLPPLIAPLEAPDPQVKNTYLVKCPRGEHRAGVIALDSGHLAYRMHGTRSVTGRTNVCTASLRTIHELPPPTRPDIVCSCPKGDHP